MKALVQYQKPPKNIMIEIADYSLENSGDDDNYDGDKGPRLKL